ncbi:MAG: SAM-dependent methyltransferase, partial [Flavobacteriaceae bacterium]|nr:SAM-dependent methyltransferase [Flavobacteriaceae bacterium]
MQKGKLYLIPTTIGDTAPLEVLPISVRSVIEQIDLFIVEHEKNARRFIKRITPKKNQQSLTLFPLNKFTATEEKITYLNPCLEGISIGILSDAGVPCIADPGAEMVALAHQYNIQVVPLIGPSSILMAMMASGFNGQSFAFNGYLPIDKNEKKKRLKFFESRANKENQSQIFIETPYRNMSLLEDLLQLLHPETKLCIACNISLPDEYIRSKSVEKWR